MNGHVAAVIFETSLRRIHTVILHEFYERDATVSFLHRPVFGLFQVYCRFTLGFYNRFEIFCRHGKKDEKKINLSEMFIFLTGR